MTTDAMTSPERAIALAKQLSTEWDAAMVGTYPDAATAARVAAALRSAGLDVAESHDDGYTVAILSTFGDLHDYYHGWFIRPATADERDESRAAGPEGVFDLRGRSVYVQE